MLGVFLGTNDRINISGWLSVSKRRQAKVYNFVTTLLIAFAYFRIHLNSEMSEKTKFGYMGLIAVTDVVVKLLILKVNSFFPNKTC